MHTDCSSCCGVPSRAAMRTSTFSSSSSTALSVVSRTCLAKCQVSTQASAMRAWCGTPSQCSCTRAGSAWKWQVWHVGHAERCFGDIARQQSLSRPHTAHLSVEKLQAFVHRDRADDAVPVSDAGEDRLHALWCVSQPCDASGLRDVGCRQNPRAD